MCALRNVRKLQLSVSMSCVSALGNYPTGMALASRLGGLQTQDFLKWHK